MEEGRDDKFWGWMGIHPDIGYTKETGFRRPMTDRELYDMDASIGYLAWTLKFIMTNLHGVVRRGGGLLPGGGFRERMRPVFTAANGIRIAVTVGITKIGIVVWDWVGRKMTIDNALEVLDTYVADGYGGVEQKFKDMLNTDDSVKRGMTIIGWLHDPESRNKELRILHRQIGLVQSSINDLVLPNGALDEEAAMLIHQYHNSLKSKIDEFMSAVTIAAEGAKGFTASDTANTKAAGLMRRFAIGPKWKEIQNLIKRISGRLTDISEKYGVGDSKIRALQLSTYAMQYRILGESMNFEK